MATNRLDREVDNREFSLSVLNSGCQQNFSLSLTNRLVMLIVGFVLLHLNTADPRNLSAKLREGWEPVTIRRTTKIPTVS